MKRLTSPHDAFAFFLPHLHREVEELWVAALNADKVVLGAECLFRGTVDHCLFHPRDVFRFVVRHNATAFLLAHNHPSGNTEPSEEDIKVTEQVLTLSLIMEVAMVDHVIVGGTGYFSFLEAGLLKVDQKPCLAMRSII